MSTDILELSSPLDITLTLSSAIVQVLNLSLLGETEINTTMTLESKIEPER